MPDHRAAGTVGLCFLFVNEAAIGNKNVETMSLACVACVSEWFWSKERGTRVKDCVKNGTLVLFFTQPKLKIPLLRLSLLQHQLEKLATQATVSSKMG